MHYIQDKPCACLLWRTDHHRSIVADAVDSAGFNNNCIEVASLEFRHEGVHNILFFYHLVLGFVLLVVGLDMRVLTVTFVSPASSPLLVLGGGTKTRGLEMRLQEEW